MPHIAARLATLLKFTYEGLETHKNPSPRQKSAFEQNNSAINWDPQHWDRRRLACTRAPQVRVLYSRYALVCRRAACGPSEKALKFAGVLLRRGECLRQLRRLNSRQHLSSEY